MGKVYNIAQINPSEDLFIKAQGVLFGHIGRSDVAFQMTKKLYGEDE